ncbi:hypothetical protein [Bacillus atrophaeus]|uniref:hypothetical protein n=1 Tax=Bacillus atrophaeus TaxID=1452 RepID=UPI002E1B5C8A|nr:hypothetical protein [Bacillus atrophaeus]MED4825773.1 hypothetical protein [Bacillus atrophaeus]MED4845869.1 hypothetical protein [Bacillus atrophaeus]
MKKSKSNMLIHHTTIENACNILGSKQLWLKSVGETSDSKEIHHYMSNFNLGHRAVEYHNHLANAINQIGSTSFNQFQHNCNWSNELWESGKVNGMVLADILRKDSYLTCFTEKPFSEFHNNTYGDISFEFDNVPFDNKYGDHYLLKEKIKYFDSKKLEKKLKLNSIKPFQEISVENLTDNEKRKFLIGKLKELKKLQKNVNENFVLKLKSWKNSYKFISNPDENIKSIVEFLTNEMNDQRIIKRYSPLTEEQFENFRRMAPVTKDILETTHMNLLCCFLKDNEFRQDNETRIIAIPMNKKGLNNDLYLKIPLKIESLKKIRISPNSLDKDNKISLIERKLIETELSHVIVE